MREADKAGKTGEMGETGETGKMREAEKRKEAGKMEETEKKENCFFRTDKMAVGYQGRALLEQINLHLKKGEILTLIGPNGAGKTTVLKSLMGQLPPVAGTAYLDGKSLSAMTKKELALRLSVVMTNRIRPELFSCFDVVASGRYPYTNKMGFLSENDKEKVREALRLVHSEELADSDFTRISDGQRQRIMLAKAICQEPELMLLDEPTTFLDIRYKLELLEILRGLAREKKMALILSLHELDLAQKISDKVACIKDGAIHRYGTPEEIFTADYMEELYDVDKGSYDELFGCLELAPVKGEPEVFVIAGGGSGILTYRKLLKQGICFATGVLAENDVDYRIAKVLAQEVVSEQAFEPVSEESVNRAIAIIKRCKKVICPLRQFGSMNEGNRRLLEYAKKNHLL